MAKKIRNRFALNKPGYKREKAREFVAEQRMIARGELLKEVTLAVAWTLRNDYGYGKTRIKSFVENLFETISDSKIGGLFEIQDVQEQLITEIDLDITKLFEECATKHFERVEAKYGKSI